MYGAHLCTPTERGTRVPRGAAQRRRRGGRERGGGGASFAPRRCTQRPLAQECRGDRVFAVERTRAARRRHSCGAWTPARTA